MLLTSLVASRMGAALWFLDGCDCVFGKQVVVRNKIEQIDSDDRMMEECILFV